MVVDPDDTVDEYNEVNNSTAKDVPLDLVAIDGPNNFYWRPLEDGGGFVFSYHIDNSTGVDFPNTTIDFYWAMGEQESDKLADERAYSFNLNDEALPAGVTIVSGGNDLTASGDHAVFARHEALTAGNRSPAVIGNDPAERATHLVMVVDPSGEGQLGSSGNVVETNEYNNVVALEVVPLVVNVLTHGFNPNPFDWGGFRQPWKDLGETLEQIPDPDTILDGRVESYVSEWDSSSGWIGTFINVGLAFLLPPPDDLLALETGRKFKKKAGDNAEDAAHSICRDVTSLLEDQEQPPLLHLIGHSRGAAVNARVSRLLQQEGYAVDQYTSLDGYSTDWPDLSGIWGDISIVEQATAERLVNYRVERSLSQVVVDLYETIVSDSLIPDEVDTLLESFADWRAPNRAQFEDIMLMGWASQPFSNHLNAVELYAESESSGRNDFPQPDNPAEGTTGSLVPYILDNYVGEHRSDSPGSSSSFSSTDAMPLDVGVEQVTSGNAFGNFDDGGFEELGTLWRDFEATVFPPTDSVLVNYWITMMNDPVKLLGATWTVTGNARLIDDGGNTLVELLQSTDTSIGQLLVLDPQVTTVEFDLSVTAAGPGDALEVLFNQTVLGAFDLASLPPSGHYSVPLSEYASQNGALTFRIVGPVASPATVYLDNLAIATPPSFVLTAPMSGTYTAGQTVSIQWTAEGVVPGSTISLCYDEDTTWWNGNEHWIAVDSIPAANGNGSYPWNTTGVAAGTYYIAGYLYDWAGTFTYSHLTQSIQIQDQEQTFVLSAPTSGAYTAGETVSIQWTAAGVVSGSTISLGYDEDTTWWNGNEHWIEVDQVAAANGNHSYDWDTTGVASGTYYVMGYMYDWAGTFTTSHLTASIQIEPAVADRIGVHRGEMWYIDRDANQCWTPPGDAYFAFGAAGDEPVVGDWNGDGVEEIGVHRGSMWYLDVDGNGRWNIPGDAYFAFGVGGDESIVGDWNGDGTDEVGVHRGDRWYLDYDGNRRWNIPGDRYFTFGIVGDDPVVGDWDGDGIDEVGVHRGDWWYLDHDGNHRWNTPGDRYFRFGISGDEPVVGDWNGDGVDEVGVHRGRMWYLDADGNRRWNVPGDTYFSFGVPGDNAIVGRWASPSSASAGAQPATLALDTLDGAIAADVQVSAHVDVTMAQARHAGLVARYRGPEDRNMCLGALVNHDGAYTAEIWRNQEGTWTQLASAAVDTGVGWIAFRVHGSSLAVHLNDELVVAAVDDAIRNAGRTGARAFGGTVDSFDVTTVLPLSTLAIDAVLAEPTIV